MPKLSIVVPIYNVEKYLAECLDSILAQTLSDIEIICVNDGSTDSSLDIIKDYARQDSRIRIISKPNSGYGNSMNMGFDAATGEYIGIVESDDIVPPDMYKDLCSVADKNKLDLVKADFYTFIDDESGRVFTPKPLAKNLPQLEVYYNRVIKPLNEPEVFRLVMNTWSGIYRRDFLNNNGIRHNETPGASYQDNGLWFQTFAYAQRVMFINKPYYMLRRDNVNSSVHNKSKVFNICEEYDFVYKFLSSNQEFYDKIIGYFWLKRFDNYIWSYRDRIGEEFRYDFLFRFSQDFEYAKRHNELDYSLFKPWERDAIELIINDPASFHVQEKKRVELGERMRADSAKAHSKRNALDRLSGALTKMRVYSHDNGVWETVKFIAKRLFGGRA